MNHGLTETPGSDRQYELEDTDRILHDVEGALKRRDEQIDRLTRMLEGTSRELAEANIAIDKLRKERDRLLGKLYPPGKPVT